MPSAIATLLGMEGIGKSALVTRAMQRLAAHFEAVLFRSLRDAPSCEALLDDCLQVLAPEPLAQAPQSLERRLSLLLEHLRAFAEHPDIVSAVTWDLSGELLVSGGSDGILRWWEIQLAHLYEKTISIEICVRRSAISYDLDRKISGKLLVIWDGAPIHRAQAIKDFLKRGAGKHLHLERLSGYAPELNPRS